MREFLGRFEAMDEKPTRHHYVEFIEIYDRIHDHIEPSFFEIVLTMKGAVPGKRIVLEIDSEQTLEDFIMVLNSSGVHVAVTDQEDDDDHFRSKVWVASSDRVSFEEFSDHLESGIDGFKSRYCSDDIPEGSETVTGRDVLDGYGELPEGFNRNVLELVLDYEVERSPGGIENLLEEAERRYTELRKIKDRFGVDFVSYFDDEEIGIVE